MFKLKELFWTLTVITFVIDGVNLKKIGLYDPSIHHVINLKLNNFNSQVYNKPNAWIIEFYNEWCSTCINYVSTWTQVAEYVEGWEKLVKIGVVNCATDSNLCHDQNVKDAPFVGYYHPMMKKGSFPKELTITDHKDYRPMVNTIINVMIRDIKRFRIPQTYTHPIQAKNLKDLIASTSLKKAHKFLLFENSRSKTGKTLVLQFKNRIDTRIFLVGLDNKEFISDVEQKIDVKINGLTLVYLQPWKYDVFRANKTVTIMKLCDQVAFFGNRIKKYLGIKTIISTKKKEDSVPQYNATGIKNVTEMKLSVIDIRNAVTYSFRHEISLHSVIKNDEMRALKNFVAVLNAYYPGNRSEISLILKLNQWLQSRRQITKKQWIKMLDSSKSNETLLSTLSEYDNCKGSQPYLRGYPCSLWMTFHYLVVQDYNYNKRNKLYNPRGIADAIHGYVKHFFSCHECSMHFQKMYNATITNEVKSGEDAVIWLWNAHNKVNKRLAGTITEDPYQPKIQFPPPVLCKNCWQKINFSEHSWNRKAVLDFLIKFYNKESLNLSNPSYYNEDNKGFHFKFRQMFNIFDMGLCLFIYQAMFFLVCFLYIFFICRRRNKKNMYSKVSSA